MYYYKKTFIFGVKLNGKEIATVGWAVLAGLLSFLHVILSHELCEGFLSFEFGRQEANTTIP